MNARGHRTAPANLSLVSIAPRRPGYARAMRRALQIVLVVVLVLCAGVGLAAWLAMREPPPAGAVLYVGGPILTMDADDRVVEALATVDDRIEAVGDEATLRAWAEREGARVVELDGRALLPGFIDAHGHFPGMGAYAVLLDLNSPPIGEVERVDDLVALIAERAKETPEGDWVLGLGYDDTLLAERRHPDRADLDRASERHPVAVLHISGHLAAVNSAALALLGIDAETPDPEGGVIQRDATGQPTGVLEETAMAGVTQALTPDPVASLELMRAAGEMVASQGVTTVQSGLTPAGLVEAFRWMVRFGLVPVRLVIWPDHEAGLEAARGERSLESGDDDRLTLGAIKIVGDGSIQGYTGYLTEPYAVPPGDDPDYRGYPRYPPEELAAMVAELHRAGHQIAIHGNGDAAIDDILDAIEAAQRAHPRDDARHIVIHAQMTREDQLDRMQALGVIPSFFSLHTFYWGDRHRALFMGEERAARMSPTGSAVRRGMPFTVHADAPVVPLEPLRLVWATVNRTTRSGYVLGPDQRLTPMQALRAVTIDAAFQHFEEADKGSLEPGKLADLVILSRSPLDDPETIDEIGVEATIVGGRVVYAAD